MRQVILEVYVSLDGYSCDVDNGIRDVMMSIDDAEQEEYFVSRLRQAGTHIMGRVRSGQAKVASGMSRSSRWAV